MRTKDDIEYIDELADRIINAQTGFETRDLEVFSLYLDFYMMHREYLPTQFDLGANSPKTRNLAAISLTECFWGMTAQKWLVQEKAWLTEAREKTGSTREDGKDEVKDLASPRIITSIVATSYLYYEVSRDKKLSPNDASIIIGAALRSLNLFVCNSVFKGLTRVLKLESEEGESLYGYLRDQNMVVGASGMYLANPRVSLRSLLLLLHRKAIKPEIYLR